MVDLLVTREDLMDGKRRLRASLDRGWRAGGARETPSTPDCHLVELDVLEAMLTGLLSKRASDRITAETAARVVQQFELAAEDMNSIEDEGVRRRVKNYIEQLSEGFTLLMGN